MSKLKYNYYNIENPEFEDQCRKIYTIIIGTQALGRFYDSYNIYKGEQNYGNGNSGFGTDSSGNGN